ncbi:hydrogen peroxide-inducible genes activator [Notoacmeibacter sp. MSK16QG-6]|uniref:hydrogen peroxide-inducible genes activator n=1 Tax=Notoacmeibacter sp. MSK16QG-6 TaxID=2957982 RepID=UPI00209F1F8B|nr:hydrogen peroxide-inducible genes activator [Notoacmeibacter sp. MSK16QG-6]MCP1198405.1 hydrogen peroxide-inducible genes activator [Notoacmeibacter sp. MSK16QG-6]
MNITLRQCSYLVALAGTGHFGRAAEQVHVTQPALSSQVAQMEANLGGQLFERRRGEACLTPLGQTILPLAQSMLETAQKIEDIAQRGHTPLSGPLKLGVIPTVAPYILPALLPLLAEAHPGLELRLKEATTSALRDDLESGAVDMVIAALPFPDGPFRSKAVRKDRFLMAVSAKDAQRADLPKRPEALEPERLLLLAEGHCLRDQALDVCGAHQGHRAADLEATSMATLLQMVACGLGVTLLPEMAVPSEIGNSALRIVPFSDPQPERTIGLIWRTGSARQQDADRLAEHIAAL